MPCRGPGAVWVFRDEEETSSDSKGYKYELLYEGIAGDVIKLAYREYTPVRHFNRTCLIRSDRQDRRKLHSAVSASRSLPPITTVSDTAS
jgi:hypothetical protein